MIEPFYSADGITLYHGDCRDLFSMVSGHADCLVTDPPYGIDLRSGMGGRHGDCSIRGDSGIELRDWVIDQWGNRPALVFGSWKQRHPAGTRHVLIWEKGEHVGMGDLALPWKPNCEEIYVLGHGFRGRRTGSVLKHLAVAGCVGTRTSRWHPTEKPESLMVDLIRRCPGVIIDPFVGSGTTLVAAKALGRRAIGIEIDRKYCDAAVSRLAQGILLF